MVTGPKGEGLRWCGHCRQHKKVKLTVHNADLESVILALLPSTKQQIVKRLCYPKNETVKHLALNEEKVRSAIWQLRFVQHKVYQSNGVLKVV
jgi:hypothetical protein